MKQGTKFPFPVQFGIPIDTIESCEFIFTQGETELLFMYPSDRSVLLEDAIGLIWTPSETFMFDTAKSIRMDTRIKIKGSEMNPQTNIVTLTMAPTLFKKDVDVT